MACSKFLCMETRSRNSVRNIISGMSNRFVQIALPFISRTVLIYTLGSEYLGLNSLFTSILMVLSLSELGIGSALVYSMYKPVAENDFYKIRALLSLYKKLFRIIGVVLFVLGSLVAPFLREIIKGDIPADINIYILYFIYLINTSVSYFVFAHKKALLTAYQRSDVLTNVNSIITIVLYVSQILLLLLFKNYYTFVIIYPLFTIAENLWIGYEAKKRYPDIECEGKVSQDDKNEIKQHVKGIALQQFCSTSRNSLDSIVISIYLGLNTIAMYSNYFYIMSSVHAFLYQIPNAIRAIVGNSVASESVDKNYDDFNSMYFLYMWISGWCTACLVCLYQPFMNLWVGSSLMFPMFTVALFCLYFTLLNMSDIIALYKDAAGLWWHGRYRVVIEAIANLILNFLLGYLWGVNGILLATIITMVFLGHGYGGWIVFHYYFKDKSYLKFIALQLLYLIIIGVVSLGSYWVCSLLSETNAILRLVYIALICLVVPNIFLLLLFWKLPHFKHAVRFLINVKNSYRGNAV